VDEVGPDPEVVLVSIIVDISLALGVSVWALGCVILLWTLKSADGRSALVLRVALMCPLIITSWGLTYDISFRRGQVIGFLMTFGPVAAGFYAGVSKRTYQDVLNACLATTVMVAVCWSALLCLLHKSLGDIREIVISVVSLALLFEAVGAVSGLTIPALWARVAEHRTG